MTVPKLPGAPSSTHSSPKWGANNTKTPTIDAAKPVKAETHTIENRMVDPPVMIHAVKVFSFQQYNKNTYWRKDSPEGKATQRNADELSFMERGHAYTCKVHLGDPLPQGNGLSGRGYSVKSMRICDEETEELLQGLTFFHSDSAIRNGKWAEYSQRITALDFSFLLPGSDFAIFRGRVQGQKGYIRTNDVLEEHVRGRHQDLELSISAYVDLYAEVAAQVHKLTGVEEQESYEKALLAISDAEFVRQNIQQEVYALVTLCDQAKYQQIGSHLLTIYEVLCSTAKTRAEKISEATMSLSMLRATVKSRLISMLEKRPVEGNTISLVAELSRLKSIFPVLSRLSAISNDALSLTLPDGSLAITTKEVKFAMNDDALRRLTVGIHLGGTDSGGRFGDI